MTMGKTIIAFKNIKKVYRIGFWGKPFVALDNLNLEIKQGEILGYIGPNGAGKTTTFKMLLDLIRPDDGSIEVYGKPNGQEARNYIGFLPENPYFYMYLTALESLHFNGQLKGMGRLDRKKRIPQLLELVNLEHAADRPLKKFSRGMLQRIGIAQALINDPDILILDEPMSGLDPNGRKRMRDIILACKEAGKTVIFSSHILSDVEIMCDRAATISKGKLQKIIEIKDILDKKIEEWEITCTSLPDNDNYDAEIVYKTKNQILLKVRTEPLAKSIVMDIEKKGGRVLSFGPQRISLEDLYSETGS
ncbi:MAG: ABC transporter ATP-binding protein [Desulfobacterales bacterium]|nr:ABC transporter ATP-binding protein [Desulfobacterales bacterium]